MPTVDCYCTLPANCNPVEFNVQVLIDNIVKSNESYECLHNCCDEISWYCMEPPVTQSSSSSSSGSIQEYITIECCANPLPTILYATVVSLSNCDCVAGTFEILWNPSMQSWIGYSCLEGNIVQFILSCSEPMFNLFVICENMEESFNIVGATCDPFEIDVIVSLPDNCCVDGGSVSILITE